MQPSKAWIINDTIEKNKRVFKIPVYQRNYDWTTRECEKLYSDIIDAFESQRNILLVLSFILLVKNLQVR